MSVEGDANADRSTKPDADGANSRADSPEESADGDQTKPEIEPMIATRNALPPTRSSVTHKFSVNGHEGYLTIGLYEDGLPGEIFIKMAKEGSTMKGMVQAFCRAFSLAIQYGLPLEEACARFRGMRFEPMGCTNNPNIPEATSIVDYIAHYIEYEFCTDTLTHGF